MKETVQPSLADELAAAKISGKLHIYNTHHDPLYKSWFD